MEKRNHDILFEAMVCSPQNIVPNICFGHTNVLEVKRNCMCSCVGVGCTAHANAVGCTARAANKIDVGQECKDLCFLSTKLLTLIIQTWGLPYVEIELVSKLLINGHQQSLSS